MQTDEILLAVGLFGVIALAAALAGIRRLRRMHFAPKDLVEQRGEAGHTADSAKIQVSDLDQPLRRTLRLDLSLAGEHVHSIRWLLEIARQHQQPIPSVALTNLVLVSKHLEEMQRRIGNAEEEAESSVGLVTHRPEDQPPARPRLLSFRGHASPSDISTPYD
jgi:hypothetical protein